MSSSYGLICLSHDPALVLGDLEEGYDARHINSRDHDAMTGHVGCDIVLGRFSYPLIEVMCFGVQLPGPTACKGCHQPIWYDKDILRLVLAVSWLDNAGVDSKLLDPWLTRCWPIERLKRISSEF